MRDRLELFGGQLQLASAPGRGTVIAASVPLAGEGT
jgi:signal transduction histidine kinase